MIHERQLTLFEPPQEQMNSWQPFPVSVSKGFMVQFLKAIKNKYYIKKSDRLICRSVLSSLESLKMQELAHLEEEYGKVIQRMRKVKQ